MRVLVCGSRGFTEPGLVFAFLDGLYEALTHMDEETVILSGLARGPDTLAKQWSDLHGLSCEGYPADWERYGKRAGILRNQQMLDAGPDLVVAFWDGESTGTKNTIDSAKARRIKTLVIKA